MPDGVNCPSGISERSALLYKRVRAEPSLNVPKAHITCEAHITAEGNITCPKGQISLRRLAVAPPAINASRSDAIHGAKREIM
ncbi:MAG: hypothetical protein IIZ66_05205, partial [Clostridia bacterium]|nr:hypothetical protein [Clostridia bacterium]